MPSIRCPIPSCDYSTDDVDAAIVVQLLQLHQVTHNQQQALSSHLTKVEKVKRPTISASGTSEEWSYFKTRWTEYVEATGINGKDLVIQLLECCDEELRKDLTRSAGGSLTTKNEEAVLEAIQKLAVRVENIMVARVTLHDMQQDRDEPVRVFCSRLKGQADVCQFTTECIECKKTVDYTNQIVRDCIIRGISDDDIRLDVLGHENQDMELDVLVSYIESKETGKRSISRFSNSQGVAAAQSSYHKQHAKILRETSTLCSHCGKNGHGNGNNKRTRREKCPAYGQTCTSCNRKHHFSSVCKSKNKLSNQTTTSEETSSTTNANSQDAMSECFYPLYSDSTLGIHSVVLDHHLYDNMRDRWLRQPSKP